MAMELDRLLTEIPIMGGRRRAPERITPPFTAIPCKIACVPPRRTVNGLEYRQFFDQICRCPPDARCSTSVGEAVVT